MGVSLRSERMILGVPMIMGEILKKVEHQTIPQVINAYSELVKDIWGDAWCLEWILMALEAWLDEVHELVNSSVTPGHANLF